MHIDNSTREMPHNYLVTGKPRTGKTTVIQSVYELLSEQGVVIHGVYCPEIRENGDRVGFEITDFSDEKSRILAHIDEDGPRVGKYHINTDSIDYIVENAFRGDIQGADVIMIDEIAPMEVKSNAFKDRVRDALSSKTPVLAAIHSQSQAGFIGETKERKDTELIEVTKQNRENLPQRLKDELIDRIKGDKRA